MSKPSERKRRKQKARQRVDAKKKYQDQQRQLYADKFPLFVYKTNGAPQEFVSLIQWAIRRIDLRDPQLFSGWETKVFKLTKQYGSAAIRNLVHGGNIFAQRDFICKLGELVFSRIPEEVQTDLKRIADHFDPQPADIVGTAYLANKLGCTSTWIAQMVREGTIPKGCIVPGSGDGRQWKFYRRRIEAWLASRSEGAP
jgi:hypothetical protein